MELVIADRSMTPLRIVDDFDLDLAYGEDENSFELTCPPGLAPPQGGYFYSPGTEYGGTVDEVVHDVRRGGGGAETARGRTWHGVLAGKRIVPEGSSHVSVQGGVAGIISSLLDGAGLSGLFLPDGQTDASVPRYEFPRFCDLYSGLRGLLAANGLKLVMRSVDGAGVLVGARPAVDWSRKVDGDLMDFEMTSVGRCTNHLVCAGSGEMEGRAVVHFYADAAGRVSHTQTLFGVDEIAELYSYTTSDAEQLEKDGRKRLEDLQGEGVVDAEVSEDIEIDVGDTVAATDPATGASVTAPVAKKIVKAEDGVASYSYEAGTPTTGTSASESSDAGYGR